MTAEAAHCIAAVTLDAAQRIEAEHHHDHPGHRVTAYYCQCGEQTASVCDTCGLPLCAIQTPNCIE